MAARRVILAILVLLATAAPAAANVAVGKRRVVVTTPAGGAEVDRNPVRITFRDAAGRVVLRQVANTLRAPVPAGDVDGEPAGTHTVRPSVYAPFAFEVGGRRNLQQPGGLWAGNMLAGARAGTVFSAQRVRTVTSTRGGGVRLVLDTTDPTRTIALRIEPDRDGALRLRATLSSAGGVTAFTDSFASGAREAFRGFGGRHNALDQHGNDFYDWVEQENLGAGPLKHPFDFIAGTGGPAYLFPNGPAAAYYVQNQFVSSRGYGFLLNDTALSRWRLDSDRGDAWQVATDSPRLDYDVAFGAPRRALRSLTAIGGRQRVPARWTMGPTLYRGVHLFSDDERSYRDFVVSDLRNIAKHRLPVEAYAYEGWHALPRRFVRETNARLRARGIHPVGYLRSFVANDGPFFDDQRLYDEAYEHGYAARTPTGQPYVYISSTRALVIDFTNPAAVRWWARRVRAMLDLGFDGFMQDFGEQVQSDMRFRDGSTGETMHNRYPVLYHRITRRIVNRYMATHPRRRIFFFTRAGFSGRPGAAAYENSNFPGDETTDWQRSSGIASLIPDMLNRGVGGAFGFNTDIGGYLDSYADQQLDAELFQRWTELSALLPFFRVHNSCCTLGTRMPWSLGKRTLAVWRRMARLHLRARPYMRRLWRNAVRTGTPIARPLWLQFPGDGPAAAQDQEFALGSRVLVAPVVVKGARSRSVRFPAGCWRQVGAHARFHGPGSARVAAPLGRLPWFVRCGARSPIR